MKVKRTRYDTTDLTNKALLAAQQDNSPDVLIVDNPVVSTLAEAGVLTTTDDNKLDTSQASPNLLAAGQSGGKTYGVPIGANTLALYYNKAVLKEAGVDIASVKDWTSLTAALAKVKAAGKKGITFSAIGTEEGSFQFLPWFWGSGAQLTALDSDQARLRAVAVEGLAGQGLRAQLGHQQHPDHQLAGVRHRRVRVQPRTAPGSWPTPRRPASTTASSPSRAPRAATRAGPDRR